MIQKVYPQHILYFTYLFNCGSKADTQISPLLSVLSTASPPCYYLRTDYPAQLTLISCILAGQLYSLVSGCQQAFLGVQAVCPDISSAGLALSPFSACSNKKRHRP